MKGPDLIEKSSSKNDLKTGDCSQSTLLARWLHIHYRSKPWVCGNAKEFFSLDTDRLGFQILECHIKGTPP